MATGMDMREAVRIAREMAEEAGYTDTTTSDVHYDEDDGIYEVELENDDTVIKVAINNESGKVIEFTTD
ncbi:MAG: PepSY domain-containing protein [Thaumarchaeota archaeon]|nr:PepSY domain-containing protein [Nitrososphaerota archaeon]MCL5317432.1 PepSY domain-containing protein [Nitrososphaerota archaeon]